MREVLPRLRHPEVLRAFLLLSHYRGPINYSTVQLKQADAALERLYTALRGLPVAGTALRDAATERFEAALCDDLNTPEALAVLQGLARELNALRDRGEVAAAAQRAAQLRQLGAVLGLLQLAPEEWFKLQGQGFGAVSQIWSWAQEHGRAITNGPGVVPKPGDLIVFGDEHVGIVDQVLPNGDIETIEGNYSNQVSQVIRSPTEATGYVSMG